MKQQVQSMASRAQYYMAMAFIMLATLLGAVLFAVPSAHAADCQTISLKNGPDCSKAPGQPTDLFGDQGVFSTVTNVLLFLIGAVSVIMLIIGGIRYTISNGDTGAVTSAKNTILYAIIGLVVAILAYAAVAFVTKQFAAPS